MSESVKIIGTCVLLACMAVGIAFAGNYDQYSKVYLGWQKPLKVLFSYNVEEEGLYRIVFQAQVVNDSAACGRATNVMVNAKLFVNGEKIKGWTENVDPTRHYGCPTIVKDMYLYPGDVVELKMRADSSKQYPSRSVFVLTDPDRCQFDIVRS